MPTALSPLMFVPKRRLGHRLGAFAIHGDLLIRHGDNVGSDRPAPCLSGAARPREHVGVTRRTVTTVTFDVGCLSASTGERRPGRRMHQLAVVCLRRLPSPSEIVVDVRYRES